LQRAKQKAVDAPYRLEGDSSSAQHCALETFAAGGFVECLDKTDSTTSWVLTHCGASALQSSYLLSEPDIVLDRRRDLPDNDLTLFELLRLMEDGGWVCHVKPKKAKRGRRKKTAGDEVGIDPVDFMKGLPTVWWLRPDLKSVFREYLLALRRCQEGSIKDVVQHFQPKGYYTALLDGVPYAPKRKKSRQADFSFRVPGEARPQERPPPRRRVRQRTKSKGEPDAGSCAGVPPERVRSGSFSLFLSSEGAPLVRQSSRQKCFCCFTFWAPNVKPG
jgi:hypothetical protein